MDWFTSFVTMVLSPAVEENEKFRYREIGG